MTMQYWPSATEQKPLAATWSGGPQETKAIFDPEVGEPLTRPRTTGVPYVYTFGTPPLDAAQSAALRDWYEIDLRNGSLDFGWRHPKSGILMRWKIIKNGFIETDLGADYSAFEITVMLCPGVPWWSPYGVPSYSIFPELEMDFVNGVYGINGNRVNLPEITTTTRAGATATYVGADGLIAVAAANTPRIDYDPTTLVGKGLLVEPARTNIHLKSQDFSTSYITLTGSAITDGFLSPDGTFNAANFLATDTTTGQRRMYYNGNFTVTPATIYSVSVYIKKVFGQAWCGITFAQGLTLTELAIAVRVNLTTGAYTNQLAGGAGLFCSVEDAGGGWWRCKFVGTTGVSTGYRVSIIPLDADVAVNSTCVGVIGRGVRVWGFQIELGWGCTSYIPTTTAAVTRNKDDVVLTNFDWYGAKNGGTFWAEATPDQACLDPSSAGKVFQADDGTGNNRIEVRATVTTSIWRLITAIAGVTIDTLTSPAAAPATLGLKSRFGCKVTGGISSGATSFVLAIIGLIYDTPTNGVGGLEPNITRVTLGGDGGSAQLGGHISQFQFYNPGLTNGMLQDKNAA